MRREKSRSFKAISNSKSNDTGVNIMAVKQIIVEIPLAFLAAPKQQLSVIPKAAAARKKRNVYVSFYTFFEICKPQRGKTKSSVVSCMPSA